MTDILKLTDSQQAERGFYPTPDEVANEMLKDLGDYLWKYQTILEPSAGKGDLCDSIKRILSDSRRNYMMESEIAAKIDCIEIDPNLQSILKGKGYRVVHDDFLTFETPMYYDLIVMNPPFYEGDKHLLKALSLVSGRGGQVVCLLNSQTIENPYTQTRKTLLEELEKADECEIKKLSNAFSSAERRTDVEVCIVKVKFERKTPESDILKDMRKAMPIREPEYDKEGKIIKGDWRAAIVDHYNYEVSCGIKLINEWLGMRDTLRNSITKEDYSKTMLNLTTASNDREANANTFVKDVRFKYWKALFHQPEFTKQLTNNLQSKLWERLAELKDYEFSEYNIICLQLELSKEVNQGVAETIMKLFEDWTHTYHFSEGSNNIWYYNGWKTNDCFAVNQRVIIPMYNAINVGWGKDRFELGYEAARRLSDIEKVFDYLNADVTEHVHSAARIVERYMAEHGTARNIQCKYFTVTLYKKGTCHIKFTNLEVLKKFNLFAARGKNWLPPSYGKKAYKDMDSEEKAVIDSFEGEEEYSKVLANADYYLMDNTSEMLKIGGSQ